MRNPFKAAASAVAAAMSPPDYRTRMQKQLQTESGVRTAIEVALVARSGAADGSPRARAYDRQLEQLKNLRQRHDFDAEKQRAQDALEAARKENEASLALAISVERADAIRLKDALEQLAHRESRAEPQRAAAERHTEELKATHAQEMSGAQQDLATAEAADNDPGAAAAAERLAAMAERHRRELGATHPLVFRAWAAAKGVESAKAECDAASAAHKKALRDLLAAKIKQQRLAFDAAQVATLLAAVDLLLAEREASRVPDFQKVQVSEYGLGGRGEVQDIRAFWKEHLPFGPQLAKNSSTAEMRGYYIAHLAAAFDPFDWSVFDEDPANLPAPAPKVTAPELQCSQSLNQPASVAG